MKRYKFQGVFYGIGENEGEALEDAFQQIYEDVDAIENVEAIDMVELYDKTNQ